MPLSLHLVLSGCLLALLTAEVHGNASTPEPVPTIAVRASHDCDTWSPAITAEVGQCLEFRMTDPSLYSSVIEWSFEGQPAPDDVEIASGCINVRRHWAQSGTYVVTASTGGGPPSPPVTVTVFAKSIASIEVTLTADNGYLVGTGTACHMNCTSAVSVYNTSEDEIYSCLSGPETYTIKAPRRGYIYVVAWSDDHHAQGVLGQFRRIYSAPLGSPLLLPFVAKGAPVYTGGTGWEVFATGIDVDGGAPPSCDLINAQIRLANERAGDPATSSITWVGVGGEPCMDAPHCGVVPTGRLRVGEFNDALMPTGSCVNVFPQVCGIEKPARWMWYSPSSACAFTPGADMKEFLIFRLPVPRLPRVNVTSTQQPDVL